MATTEEIEAAYNLVFEAEKAQAEQLIALIESVHIELQALAASVPATGNNSTVLTYINQSLGNVNMLAANLQAVKNVYGLNPEPEHDPTMVHP